MYQVIINHENNDIVIGDITAKDISKRLLSGKINKERNAVGNFEFDIPLDNIGYNYLNPMKTQIRVLNTFTNKNVFEGRILKQSNLLESEGKVYKTFKAEDKLGYLIDSVQVYGEYNSINEAITALLNTHNLCVEDWKKIYIGEITLKVDTEEKIVLNYKDSLENIKDLISSYGGEINIRTEKNINYFDYKDIIGEYTETEIKLGVNLKKFEEDIDPTQCYSRVMPVGAKLKTTDSEGKEVDSEERITIASINNNSLYIEDEELIKKIGYVTKILEYDDEEDKDALKQNAIEFLKTQKLSISNNITALDLSILGLKYDAFTLGNFYKLDVPFFNVDYYVRVVKETIDINNPHTSSLTFGDKVVDIKDYQLESKKQVTNYEQIKLEVENTAKKVEKINKSVTTNTKKVETLEGDLSGYVKKTTYNNFVNTINENFNKVNNEIKNIKERLTKLEGGTTT